MSNLPLVFHTVAVTSHRPLLVLSVSKIYHVTFIKILQHFI